MDNLAKITQAATILKQGGVIVCPTEGVYGLSALANNSQAIERIIKIKHRALNKGLIVVAANVDMLSGLIDMSALNEQALSLVHSKWPGHTTLILPASDQAPKLLTGGRNTLAVRVSSFSLLSHLCFTLGAPIVSTSANISGSEPLATIEQLRNTFASEVDYILDEPCQGLHKPSTIYDALSGKVLRP